MADTEAKTLQKLESSGRDLKVSGSGFLRLSPWLCALLHLRRGFWNVGRTVSHWAILAFHICFDWSVLSVQVELAQIASVDRGPDTSWLDHFRDWILDCRVQNAC